MTKLENTIKEFEAGIKDFSPADTSDERFKEVCEAALALLKAQEPVKPYMDFDGHDVWRCGNCGAAIFHLDHTQADEDAQNYAKFCRQCGQAVKWDDR